MKLEITKEKVLAAASKCETAKGVLKEMFPEVFKSDFADIKTVEDACDVLGIDLCDLNARSHYDTADEIAYKKLKIIARAINNGWTPEWNNTNQPKYYPYFRLSSGFGFSVTCYSSEYDCSTVSSRLCFETAEKAEHAGKQFVKIYENYMTIKK